MPVPPAHDPLSSEVGHPDGVIAESSLTEFGPDQAADPVEWAMAVLRAQPYGPGASPEQERACAALYRTVVGRLLAIGKRFGLDGEQMADVVHPKFHQFVTRDVCKIGSTRADMERWLSVVCGNAARTLLALRIRRTNWDREVARQIEVDSEGESVWLPMDETPDVTESAEPRWLDARFPAHIDREQFVAALSTLTPAQRRLFDVAFRHLQTREGVCRLPASEIARELGTTPGTVSVRLSELMKKLRQACGGLSDASA